MKKKQFVFLLFLLFGNNILAQDYTENEKILCISQIWRDAKDRFHSPDNLLSINWDSLYVSSLNKSLKAKDDNEFYLLIREFLAKLNDGHSDVNYNTFLFNNFNADFIPIEIKCIKNDYYILGIDESLSEKVPLASKIIKLNDLPIQEYLNHHVMQYVSGSTMQDKTDKALQFLCSSNRYSDSICLQIETPQKDIRTVYLKYDAKKRNIGREQMVATKYSMIKYNPSTSAYLVKDSKLRNYYYLRFDTFYKSNVSNLIRKEKENINKAQYIVLDLRNNSGGSELEADSLLMCFLKTDTLITYRSLTRKDNAYYAAMGYGYPQYEDYYQDMAMDTLPADTLIKNNLPLFTQPLFVLIGEKTYSAAENFLITLKQHYPKRAILIGMPTGGSTGAPFVRRLPHHNSYYRICTRKPYLSKGLFDDGIQPDYSYEKNIEDYLKGTDKIFNVAESIFNNIQNESK